MKARAKRVTIDGASADYDRVEMIVMRGHLVRAQVAGRKDEGERVMRLVHSAKVQLDATVLADEGEAT